MIRTPDPPVTDRPLDADEPFEPDEFRRLELVRDALRCLSLACKLSHCARE